MKYFLDPNIAEKYNITEDLKILIIDKVREGLDELKSIFNI